MSKKLLPLHEPKISTYTSYGTLFSILDERLLPWVYNNFIQIRYAQGWGIFAFESHHILLKSCPGISFYILPQDLVWLKWKCLKEVIVEAIDAGYYLYIYLDRYHLPVTNSYMKRHKNHEILIYGYDLDKNRVYVADNLKSGKFMSDNCTFEEVETAHQAMEGMYDFELEIRFLKVRDVDYDCSINPEQIRMSLENYLYSKKTFDLNHEQTFNYGFDAIEQLLIQIKTGMTSKLPLDLRGFHLLYEHKILMEDRIHYLVDRGVLPQDKHFSEWINRIKQDYLVLRNLIVKFNFKKNNELLIKIDNKLRENIKEEKKFIAQLIEKVRDYENVKTLSS